MHPVIQLTKTLELIPHTKKTQKNNYHIKIHDRAVLQLKLQIFVQDGRKQD